MSTISSYSGNRFENDYKIAIVASEFNSEVVEKLLQDAKQTLLVHQINNITIIKVPGVFELPFTAQLIAAQHDAIIALGAIIRGETSHFEYVCQACTDGIMHVMLTTGVPIAFGVLTTDTMEQAFARANGTHKATSADHSPQGGGSYAARVALRLASLRRQLKQSKE